LGLDARRFCRSRFCRTNATYRSLLFACRTCICVSVSDLSRCISFSPSHSSFAGGTLYASPYGGHFVHSNIARYSRHRRLFGFSPFALVCVPGYYAHVRVAVHAEILEFCLRLRHFYTWVYSANFLPSAVRAYRGFLHDTAVYSHFAHCAHRLPLHTDGMAWRFCRRSFRTFISLSFTPPATLCGFRFIVKFCAAPADAFLCLRDFACRLHARVLRALILYLRASRY